MLHAFCTKIKTELHAKMHTKGTEQYSTHCAWLLHA